METFTVTQIKFTPIQVGLIKEMISNRLDTILDDPESADSFETEESLNTLEAKLTSHAFVFTDEEKKWLVEEIKNSRDIAQGHVLESEIRHYNIMLKALVGVEKTFPTTEPKPKDTSERIAWSETGSKNGVPYSHSQRFQYNDGGRSAAGYKGDTGDCVTRAICNASGLPYQEVYDVLANGNATQRKSKRQRGGRFSNKGQRTAAKGIYTGRKWFKEYMKSIGFRWVPTMLVGQGCKVHLRGDELPAGRLVVAVSKHYTAMIDGIIIDTYSPDRNGTRCVYGYWILNT